jgi:hypothetical protein
MTSSVNSVRPSYLYEEFTANIANVVNAVARRTESESIGTAAAMLRVDLSRSGVRADLDWCQRVLETLRRGDKLTIDVEEAHQL